MNLIRAEEGQFVFQLARRERHLLLALLELYPRIPAGSQPLSRSGRLPDQEASQHLLEEALAEQRTENRDQVRALLADSKRFQENTKGWRLSLSLPDLEWLLQVLNDIRIGSWVLLGSPEERAAELNEKTTPLVWAMEMSGYFQMQFLEALTGE